MLLVGSGICQPVRDVANRNIVLLQAMKVEPPADARCRDKFLVQSAPITSDKEFASIANVVRATTNSWIITCHG